MNPDDYPWDGEPIDEAGEYDDDYERKPTNA